MKKTGAVLLVLSLLSMLFCQPVAANTVDVNTSVHASAEWLKANVPEPALGDEDVVLALLRGGFVSGIQEYTQGYLRRLKAHVSAKGAEEQTITASAKQAMVVVAAGVDLQKALPALWNRVNDQAAIDAEGAAAQQAVLLLFACGGENLISQAKVNLPELAAAFAATANAEGGFGAPDILATARALQGLAKWQGAPGVEQIFLQGDAYLQLNSNDFGGFNMDGQPSALATAEVVLAVACMGFDPLLLTPDSAPLLDALVVFQNQDGSYSADPDASPDANLTAVCMLAFVAKMRYDRQNAAVYDFTDAGKAEITNAPSASTASGMQSGATANPSSGAGKLLPEMDIDSTLLVVGILVGVVVVLGLLVAIFTANKKRSKKMPAPKAEKTKSMPKNPEAEPKAAVAPPQNIAPQKPKSKKKYTYKK